MFVLNFVKLLGIGQIDVKLEIIKKNENSLRISRKISPHLLFKKCPGTILS
jgi:hypothetical protein